jgi:hypothetical protein
MSRGAGRNSRGLVRARAEAEAAARGERLPPLPGTRTARPRHLEDDEQRTLFDWARRHEGRWPVLRRLHAVPNGGKRDAREAARMQGQGVRAGVPDLDLPVRMHMRGICGEAFGDAFIGLRIEMKRRWHPGCGDDKPRVSPDQADWLTALQELGHCCVLAYGWEQASEAIEAYLTGKPVPHQWSPK